jgi:predicted CopG family antitoxin
VRGRRHLRLVLNLAATGSIPFDKPTIHAYIRAYTNMKTITLDDVAYSRLKAWKTGSKESFSSVIKRVLPEPGTLGALLNFVEFNATHQLPGNDLMEASVEARSAAKSDPWT